MRWKCVIIKRFKTTGSVTNLPGRGRTCGSDFTEDGALQKTVHLVSTSTIRRHFRADKLYGRCARSKPSLSSDHKCKHLEFAKHYWNFDWNQVLWSDETEIELFGNKHPRRVWRKKKNGYTEEFRFSCFSFRAPGNLVRIHSIKNSRKYQEILNRNLAAFPRG